MSRVPKTTTISLRIDKPTAAEWRERAAASGLSVSDWIRRAVDVDQQTNLPTPQRRPVRVRDTSNDADPALMRQLAALGSNLNQIARSLNECRLVGAPVRLVEVLALLRSIEAEAAHLLPQLPPPPKPTTKESSSDAR
ncbi:TPA: plasmid mobilization relaxosome protein MobC [Aeromonas salmonicida subsp. pectinolytica]